MFYLIYFGIGFVSYLLSLYLFNEKYENLPIFLIFGYFSLIFILLRVIYNGLK